MPVLPHHLVFGLWALVSLCFKTSKKMTSPQDPSLQAPQSIVQFANNNIGAFKQLTVTLTCGTNGGAPFSKLLWILGPNPGFMIAQQQLTKPNQVATTGCILSSSISGPGTTDLAEYQQYMLSNRGRISYIRITTSDPTLYNGYLYLNEMDVNGVISPRPYLLSDYAKVSANSQTYLPTATINVDNMSLSGILSAWFDSVPVGSKVTIVLNYTAYGINAPLTPTA
jgi:hypothetical protein